MNTIATYSAWWIISQRDWWQFSGDFAYLQTQREYLRELAKQLASQVDADGVAAWRGWVFLDWATEPNEVNAGAHGLLTWALHAAGDLLEVLNERETAAQCREVSARLRGHAVGVPRSKQASALLALSGCLDAQRVNREVLARDPLEGFSTFYGFYVLQARGVAGDTSGALQVMRDFWGAMLDLGATSFWEHFEMSWADNATRIDELPDETRRDLHREEGAICFKGYRHSLCHGWASGPTAWLSRHVLGVEIVAPGCAKVRVTPQLGDLQWVEGDFPTPHGQIHVRHEKTQDGRTKSQIEAPKVVEVIQT